MTEYRNYLAMRLADVQEKITLQMLSVSEGDAGARMMLRGLEADAAAIKRLQRARVLFPIDLEREERYRILHAALNARANVRREHVAVISRRVDRLKSAKGELVNTLEWLGQFLVLDRRYFNLLRDLRALPDVSIPRLPASGEKSKASFLRRFIDEYGPISPAMRPVIAKIGKAVLAREVTTDDVRKAGKLERKNRQ